MYRGIVRKVNSSGIWVEVPELVTGETFGPCQRASTSAPSVGQSVLVADVGDPQTPDLIVVGVLTP